MVIKSKHLNFKKPIHLYSYTFVHMMYFAVKTVTNIVQMIIQGFFSKINYGGTRDMDFINA